MLNAEKTVEKTPASANPRAHWPAVMQKEFSENEFNGCVGSVLVSETDRVRVWHLSIPPGKRCNFHRHVLNYFWTAHNAGRGRNWYEDGTTSDVGYFKGETKHPTEVIIKSNERGAYGIGAMIRGFLQVSSIRLATKREVADALGVSQLEVKSNPAW